MAGAIISTIGVPRGNPEYQLEMDAIGHGFFVPMWLYQHDFTVRENLAAGALQSAQLTLTLAAVGGDRTSDRNDRRGTRFGADRRRVDQHDHRAHRHHSPDGRQPPARRAVTNEI
jgi:hypothetical protein